MSAAGPGPISRLEARRSARPHHRYKVTPKSCPTRTGWIVALAASKARQDFPASPGPSTSRCQAQKPSTPICITNSATPPASRRTTSTAPTASMSATIGRVCCVGDRGLPVVFSRKKQALSGFRLPPGRSCSCHLPRRNFAPGNPTRCRLGASAHRRPDGFTPLSGGSPKRS